MGLGPDCAEQGIKTVGAKLEQEKRSGIGLFKYMSGKDSVLDCRLNVRVKALGDCVIQAFLASLFCKEQNFYLVKRRPFHFITY